MLSASQNDAVGRNAYSHHASKTIPFEKHHHQQQQVQSVEIHEITAPTAAIAHTYMQDTKRP